MNSTDMHYNMKRRFYLKPSWNDAPHVQHRSGPDIVGVIDLRIVFQDKYIVALDAYRLECLTFLGHIELVAAAVVVSKAPAIAGEEEEGMHDKEDG